MAPPLFLLALSVPGSFPAEAEQAGWMDMVEAKVRLPKGAYALDSYARYYRFDGNRRLEAVYVHPPEPAEGGCAEVSVVGRKLVADVVPCEPGPAGELDLLAGERRWLGRRKPLPWVAHGGCAVVHVSFDIVKRKRPRASCNPSS